MNRRKFFNAAATFVAGCAIGIGLRPKIDAVENLYETAEYEFTFILDQKACEFMVFFDRELSFVGKDGERSITYTESNGKWIRKDESTRKA